MVGLLEQGDEMESDVEIRYSRLVSLVDLSRWMMVHSERSKGSNDIQTE